MNNQTEPEMSIDNILAGADTVMTPELIRLFKAAGCSPTACHACEKQIRSGHTFKLLPHRRIGERQSTDEMLCAKCGKPELIERDRRVRERPVHLMQGHISAGWGGFSRPSKEPQ